MPPAFSSVMCPLLVQELLISHIMYLSQIYWIEKAKHLNEELLIHIWIIQINCVSGSQFLVIN